jgi:hypothetical protein
MSEHEQHLMISTKVHAMFGTTVMLAGLTRLIEVCFFSGPSKSAPEMVDDDNNSDHTLAEPSPRYPPPSRYMSADPAADSGSAAAAKAFRHLPAFVRPSFVFLIIADGHPSCSLPRVCFSCPRRTRS